MQHKMLRSDCLKNELVKELNLPVMSASWLFKFLHYPPSIKYGDE